MDAAQIQAVAAVVSVVGSLVIGGFALRVARHANSIARHAVRVAEETREVSRDAIIQARRDAILASVPHLVAERPAAQPGSWRFAVRVTNGGPTVAYGILVSIAGASARSLDAVDESTRFWSGRQVALRPDATPLRVVIASHRPLAEFRWLHTRLEYVSPLGAHVQHDYLGPSDAADMRHRLHLVTIDPRDGTEPVRFAIGLGPELRAAFASTAP